MTTDPKAPRRAPAFSPEDALDLAWRFGGECDAALGLKSWLGPLQDRLVEGRVRSGSSPSLRDYGDDAERCAEIDAVLRRVADGPRGVHHVRALRVHHGREAGPHLEGLDPELGPLMVALSGRSSARLKALFVHALKDAKAQATVDALRLRAEGDLDAAQRAYAGAKERAPLTEQQKAKRAEAKRKREGERRQAYAGRTDEGGRVVFSTPAVRRAVGGGR